MKIETVFYAILQKALEKIDMLNANASPKKAKNLYDEDLVKLYEWASYDVRAYSESELRSELRTFNEIAQGLNDDYLLNMTLLGLFMMDAYFNEKGRYALKLQYGPKVTRLIKSARAVIMETNENPEEVIRDSSIAASNLYRLYNGMPELTKEVREARLTRWRNEAKRRSNATPTY